MAEKKKRAALDNRLITVTGIVIPTKWDKNEKTIAVSIATFQEHEYHVDTSNEAGQELCALLHRKIKIVGFLGPPVKNKRIITVSTYELLDNNDSEVQGGIDQIGFREIPLDV